MIALEAIRSLGSSANASAMNEPSTHEFAELLREIEQIKKRLDALECAPETGKRHAQSLEEVQLFFTKVGLTDSDAKWLWSKMVCSGWKNDGKVVKSWTHLVTAWKIAGIFPSQKQNGHTSIRDLESVIRVKTEEKDELVRKYYDNSSAFPSWRSEPQRQRFIVLKREIINLKARIGQTPT